MDKVTGSPVPTGGVLALGNFDGVHRGHQAVFSAAINLAKKEGLLAYALTFDPHPQLFFAKEGDPLLLTTLTEKRRLIRDAGVDGVITLSFTQDLANMSAEEFIDQILCAHCDVKHVVVGFDFVFGKGREGSLELLHEKLTPQGISVMDVPAECDEGGVAISSSRIRDALKEGDVKKAKNLLGRNYQISGEVQKGEQRGRLLDFPTANIALGDLMRPKYGVYVVWARRVGEDVWWPGVANLGVRPTFGKKSELFEFHLLDFRGEFYGTEWDVQLVSFLRSEKVFSGSDELKQQIKIDVEQARLIVKTK